jgi:glycosyltransferase involved in cell wall biosynthesis
MSAEVRPDAKNGPPRRGRYLIVVPVFNDWDSLSGLLSGLENVLREADMEAEVMAVDDGSTIPAPISDLAGRCLRAITALSILRLGRNLGHQRAIALALAHIERTKRFDVAVIMDADGQDRPEDVPLLIREQELHSDKIVFARRARRSEGFVFSVFYACFKLVFLLLTGKAISFGNFSALPRAAVTRLVLVSELWNHYSASVVKARLPFTTLPTRRGRRLRGRSTMNFTGLVSHGLSAISVHGDIVGVRALVVTGFLILLSVVLLGAVVGIRMATDWAIPGWASYLGASLFVVLLQAVMLSVVFVMLVLNTRKLTDIILLRDYGYFILGEETIHSRERHEQLSGIRAGLVPARS